MTCLGFKRHSEVVNKQGACKGIGGVEKSKFSCLRTKWIVPGLLALFPVRHLEKGSQEKCTKAWESRHSKDHQCLHWLSCAVKVLIKNAKVSYFYNSQSKKTDHERVSR